MTYFWARPAYTNFKATASPFTKTRTGRGAAKVFDTGTGWLGAVGEPGLVCEINALYRECWEPLHNFYLPSAKLEHKTRVGAKVKRQHDKPMTPCDRLLHSKDVDEATKERMRAQQAKINPFALHRETEGRLRSILHRALHSSRPTDSLHSAPDADKTSTAPVS